MPIAALPRVEIVGRRRCRRFRDDRDLRHVGRHQRIRRRRLEADRVRVDDDRSRVICFVYAVNGDGLFGDLRHALDRRDDVGRGEVAAVVELHALAQLEFPRRRIDRLPLAWRGRARSAPSRCAAPDSRRRARDVVVRREVVIMRIDRRDVGAEADREIGGVNGQPERAEQRDDERLHKTHGSTPGRGHTVTNRYARRHPSTTPRADR